MQRRERDERRTETATERAREPEPLPAQAAVLGLQHAAGNRAVSRLLARQPAPADTSGKPKEERGATSTLGLGDEIGVIPLDSASLGEADRDGRIHDLTVTFVNNPAVPSIQKAMLDARPIPEGFYSTTGMKLKLADILITSVRFSADPEGGKLVSVSLNFSAAEFEPVR